MPENDVNPFAWIAFVLVIGLGALFAAYRDSQNKHVQSIERSLKRAEDREDKLLTDNTSQAGTIKEQSSLLSRAVAIAESGVELAKATSAKLDSNQSAMLRLIEDNQRALLAKSEESKSMIVEQRKTIDDMARTISDLQRAAR
jgi:hypothetical protein